MSEYIPSPPVNKSFWDRLADKNFRRGFAAGFASDFVASQIVALRRSRGWNQTRLAKEAGVSQPQVSKWEGSCEAVRLDSLINLAEAFDVALSVKFVPFSEMAREALRSVPTKPIPAFDDESPAAILPTMRMTDLLGSSENLQDNTLTPHSARPPWRRSVSSPLGSSQPQNPDGGYLEGVHKWN
jgi:transcriptional regulator with XRE-family HTH domain